MILQLLKHKPLVYGSEVMTFKFVILAWFAELISTIFLFSYYDRPLKYWYTHLLPVNTIFLALFLLAFVLSNLIHLFILVILGIDASQPTKELAIKNLDPRYSHPSLMEIFPSDKGFNQLQTNLFNTIKNPKRELFAIIFSLGLIITVHATDKRGGVVSGLGNDPYNVKATDFPVIIVSLIQIVIQSIITVGALSGFLLILQIIWGLSNLTNIENIMPDISKYVENPDDTEKLGYIEGQFSLSSFRKKTNIIPEHLLPINLIILGIVLLSGSGVLYMLLLSDGPRNLTYLTVFVVLVFVSLDVFLFFYPQFAFHKIMKSSRSNMIDTLDTARELNKMKLINRSSDLSVEEKQSIWVDIKFLTFLREELDQFVPWPFNYYQLITLVASSIGIAFVTINIFGLLELASRLFNPV